MGRGRVHDADGPGGSVWGASHAHRTCPWGLSHPLWEEQKVGAVRAQGRVLGGRARGEPQLCGVPSSPAPGTRGPCRGQRHWAQLSTGGGADEGLPPRLQTPPAGVRLPGRPPVRSTSSSLGGRDTERHLCFQRLTKAWQLMKKRGPATAEPRGGHAGPLRAGRPPGHRIPTPAKTTEPLRHRQDGEVCQALESARRLTGSGAGRCEAGRKGAVSGSDRGRDTDRTRAREGGCARNLASGRDSGLETSRTR